jgi:D-sedoheptulose 7-phosphate isomerase
MFTAGNVRDEPREQLEDLWRAELEEHRAVVEATARSASGAFCDALAILETAVRAGGKILLFGNGGSASDAQHIVAELVVRYKTDRAPIAALTLAADSSTLTACANDLGYETIFARQIEALGREGDVAFAISTSGRSPNVLNALKKARAMRLETIGLAGGTGGEMPSLCHALIVVPSTTTSRIQEMHITVAHMLCKALEQRLGLV